MDRIGEVLTASLRFSARSRTFGRGLSVAHQQKNGHPISQMPVSISRLLLYQQNELRLGRLVDLWADLQGAIPIFDRASLS